MVEPCGSELVTDLHTMYIIMSTSTLSSELQTRLLGDGRPLQTWAPTMIGPCKPDLVIGLWNNSGAKYSTGIQVTICQIPTLYFYSFEGQRERQRDQGRGFTIYGSKLSQIYGKSGRLESSSLTTKCYHTHTQSTGCMFIGTWCVCLADVPYITMYKKI